MEKMNDLHNKHVIKEIPKDSYGKYAIMLMEELYHKMDIDTYHNHFIKINGKDYSCYVKKSSSLIIKPKNYLETYIKVMDENSGKVARNYVDEEEINNIDIIKKSLSIDLDYSNVQSLLKKIYAMYGINAITSSNCDTLDDWELLSDKYNGFQFIAKSNNPHFCSLNNSASYSYGSQYNEKLNKFIKIVNSDYHNALPIVEKLCSIIPEQVIQQVEITRNIKIPEDYKNLFINRIIQNQAILSKKKINEKKLKKYLH